MPSEGGDRRSVGEALEQRPAPCTGISPQRQQRRAPCPPAYAIPARTKITAFRWNEPNRRAIPSESAHWPPAKLDAIRPRQHTFGPRLAPSALAGATTKQSSRLP